MSKDWLFKRAAAQGITMAELGRRGGLKAARLRRAQQGKINAVQLTFLLATTVGKSI